MLPDVLEYAKSEVGRKSLGVHVAPTVFVSGRGRGGLTGRTRFESAAFEASLLEAKFMPSGEMRIVLMVPEEHSDEAVQLKDAFACALMVKVEKLSHGK